LASISDAPRHSAPSGRGFAWRGVEGIAMRAIRVGTGGLVLTALLLPLLGCARPAIVDTRPIAPVPDRPASLLAALPAAPGGSYAGDPTAAWYYDRNDYGPTVLRGQRSEVVDRVYTWTYDRQSISNGRVRDYLHQTTRRQRYYEQRW
jgi:hypothetical protein